MTAPSTSAKPHIVILGAGPAGVGAAYQLRRFDKARVTVLEAGNAVGGVAASFEWHGHWLDFGSHRLHPATDPEILADIKRLLGDELRYRPRHGRIRLRDRWIHFPLEPVDLLLHADKGFVAGVLGDMAKRTFSRRRTSAGNTFASVLEANLGRTICDDFYFPYAVKMWGFGPDELSAIQARRRVATGSFGKLVRKVLSAVPGFRKPGSGRFYYPVRGFGAITEAYAAAGAAAGAEFQMGWRATRLEWAGEKWSVTARRGDESLPARQPTTPAGGRRRSGRDALSLDDPRLPRAAR
jgi:protoporphyrinogen oxidase